MRLHNLFEGYKILPSIDRNRYQERDGLEGPFRAANGAVYYYDPREGKAYDPDSDMYISHDDFEQMDKARDFNEGEAYDPDDDGLEREIKRASIQEPDFDDAFGDDDDKKNESTEGATGPDYTDPEGKFVVVSDGYRFYSIGINQYAEQLPLTNRGFKSVEDAIEDAEDLLNENWAAKAMAGKSPLKKKYQAPKDDEQDRYKRMKKAQYGAMMGSLRESESDELYIEVAVSSARQANEALADARIPHETDGSNRFIFQTAEDLESALEQFGHWDIEVAYVNESVNEEASDFVRDMMRVHGWSRAKAEAEAKKRFPDEYGIDPNAGRNIEIRIDGRPWKVVGNKGHANAIMRTLKAKGKDVTAFYTDKPVSPDKRK